MTAQPVLGKTTWMIADGYMSDTVKGNSFPRGGVRAQPVRRDSAH